MWEGTGILKTTDVSFVNAFLDDGLKLISRDPTPVGLCMVIRTESDRVAQHVGSTIGPKFVAIFARMDPVKLNNLVIPANLAMPWSSILLFYP